MTWQIRLARQILFGVGISGYWQVADLAWANFELDGASLRGLLGVFSIDEAGSARGAQVVATRLLVWWTQWHRWLSLAHCCDWVVFDRTVLLWPARWLWGWVWWMLWTMLALVGCSALLSGTGKILKLSRWGVKEPWNSFGWWMITDVHSNRVSMRLSVAAEMWWLLNFVGSGGGVVILVVLCYMIKRKWWKCNGGRLVGLWSDQLVERWLWMFCRQ